jgi:hypothetical protein
MTAGMLSGLPPAIQFILYGIIGFGIVGGVVFSYFKAAAKEKAGGTGMVLAGDPSTIKLLTAALDRLGNCMDRLDSSLDRSTEAVRDATDQSARLYRHLATQAAMPPDEQLLILLKRIEKIVSRDGEDKAPGA